MQWVIQSNIYEEEGYQGFLDTLDRLKLPKTLVKVVPFEGRLEATEGELPADGADAIVMGSYTLARVARQKGWRPGAFLNNLDHTVQASHWGEQMLNASAHVCRFDSVPFQEQPFFFRPVHDTKAFSGFVCDWGYYTEWLAGMRRIPEMADPVNDPLGVNLLTLETPVMVSTKTEIYSETRVWVVEGKAVTSSGYKVGTIKRYTTPLPHDHYILKYVEEQAAIWRPNEAFVMDIADTPSGLRIIEVNNLNSAGFYRGDMARVAMAIEDWANDPSGLLW